ncbi:MAG: hypothetical protein R3E53_18745 [Myxococcota bacterium]
MTFDPEAHGAAWRPAFEAVESLVGGRILSVRRRARWRPVFWIEVERPDPESAARSASTLPRAGRGPRPGTSTRASALEEQGIPVPHVYGYCEAPAGYVMDRVPGRPDLATAESPEERDAVPGRVHRRSSPASALPLEPFRAIGLAPKRTPSSWRSATRPPASRATGGCASDPIRSSTS